MNFPLQTYFIKNTFIDTCESNIDIIIRRSKSCNDILNIFSSTYSNEIEKINIYKNKNKNKKSKNKKKKKDNEMFDEIINEQIEYNNLILKELIYENNENNENVDDVFVEKSTKEEYFIKITKRIILSLELKLIPLLLNWWNTISLIFQDNLTIKKNINKKFINIFNNNELIDNINIMKHNTNKQLKRFFNCVRKIILEWIDINYENIILNKEIPHNIYHILQTNMSILKLFEPLSNQYIEFYINYDIDILD